MANTWGVFGGLPRSRLPHAWPHRAGAAPGPLGPGATHLIALAPLAHWETLDPSRTGVNWSPLASDLYERSIAVGLFTPVRIRGRGAWWDDGRPLLHLGDRLVTPEGEQLITAPFLSPYVYQRMPRLDGPGDVEPLTVQEAAGDREHRQPLPLGCACLRHPAGSALQRERLIDWLKSVWFSRAEPGLTADGALLPAAQVVVQTRWDHHDMTARLLEQEVQGPEGGVLP
jgi:hypothetical protein